MSGGESLGSKYGDELGSSGEISGGESGSSVRISREHGYGNNEGSPVGNVLWQGFRPDGESSYGRASGEYYVGLDLCAPGGVSNRKFSGNIRENPLRGLLGADSVSERGSTIGMSYGAVDRVGLIG